MALYRNTGALHRRPRSVGVDKRFVPHGETFEPTKEELEAGLPDKFVQVSAGSGSPPPPPPPDDDEKHDVVDVDQYHTGGGWYAIPGHEGKVQGRANALAALEASADEE